jgi:2,3-bisphosphoglycerate-independent phosphoglycerate mutase
MVSPLYVLFISGWGSKHEQQDNIFTGNDPFLDHLLSSYPITMLSSEQKETTFVDLYKKISQVENQGGLSKVLHESVIRQLKIAGPDRYGLLTKVFNGTESSYEKEQWQYIPYPHGPALSETPELEVPELLKSLEQTFSLKRDAVIFSAISQLWALGQYRSSSLLREGAQYLSKALQSFIEKAIDEGARVLLVSDSALGESYKEAFSSEYIVRTESALPCMLIHPSVDGLRATDQDYASGRATQLVTSGTLTDIAPTVLALMGLDIPKSFTGSPLFGDLIKRTV